jgi:Flp pilus assembly protein TadG
MTMGFGAIEFGRLIYQQHLISNGVRDAARYASGLPPDGTYITQIKNVATNGVDSGGTQRVSYWDPAKVTVQYDTKPNGYTSCGNTQCYRGPLDLPLVTVSTSVTYQSLGFLGFLKLGSITLKATHEERVIGVR